MPSAPLADEDLSIAEAPPEFGDVWNDFVFGRKESTYAHRFEWRAVAEEAYGRTCHFLSATRDGRIAGLLPLVWMPGPLGGRRLVSLPYLDLGGPLAVDATVETELLGAAFEIGERLGSKGLELRKSAADSTLESGRYRFLLDLPGRSDELWSTIGPKVRNQVRKSQKSGLETTSEGSAALHDFYDVFRENMRELGSPVHSVRFLASVLEQFGDDARLYMTRDEEGAAVAGGIAIRHLGTLTVPWASARRSERPKCPNHSLYWTVLTDAIEEGLERFDFGRSSAGTGTFRFKKQWGATPVPLAWEHVERGGAQIEQHSPPGRARSLVIAAWRRLPQAVADRLGPRLRGHLPQ